MRRLPLLSEMVLQARISSFLRTLLRFFLPSLSADEQVFQAKQFCKLSASRLCLNPVVFKPDVRDLQRDHLKDRSRLEIAKTAAYLLPFYSGRKLGALSPGSCLLIVLPLTLISLLLAPICFPVLPVCQPMAMYIDNLLSLFFGDIGSF